MIAKKYYGNAAFAVTISVVLVLAGYSIHLKLELARARELLQEQSLHELSSQVHERREEALTVGALAVGQTRRPDTYEKESLDKAKRGPDVPPLYFEYSKVADKRQLRMVYRTYGDFLKRLQLDPVTTQKVACLLAAKDQALKDARDAAKIAGLPDASLNSALAESTKEIDAELKTLLSESNYSEMQSVPVVNMFRSMLQSSVGIDLEIAGTPLGYNQTVQIAQIWAKVQNPQSNPSFVQMAQVGRNPATGMSSLHEAVLREASSVLTTQQLEVFRSFLQEQDSPRSDISKSKVIRD